MKILCSLRIVLHCAAATHVSTLMDYCCANALSSLGSLVASVALPTSSTAKSELCSSVPLMVCLQHSGFSEVGLITEAEAKCLCAFFCALAPSSAGAFPSRCAERVVISSIIFDRTWLLTAQQAEGFHSIFREVCQCDRWEMFPLCVLNLHFSINEWLEHWSHIHLWVCELSLAVFRFSSGFSLLVFHQLTVRH